MPFGSGTPSTSNHAGDPELFTTGSFNVVADLSWDSQRVSAFFSRYHSERNCGSESDIALATAAVLFDVLEGSLQLRGMQVSLLTGCTIASLRPDILVLRSHNVPVGYCEVKRPSEDDASPLEHENVLRQAYDYAMQLRRSFRLAWTFVLLTTYEQWRVVWLDDEASNYAAGLSVVDAAAAQRSPPMAPASTPPRLSVGPIVNGIDNPGVAGFLASVLLKMARSPLLADSDSDLLWPQLTERGVVWRAPEESLAAAVAEMPADPRPPFFRVQPLGAGRDGSSWLVCKGRSKYVLKFIRARPGDESPADRAHRASAEASRWRQIWDVAQAQDVNVMGRAGLVMPFVELFASEAELREHAALARRAVEQLAERGWVHNDLRHGGRRVKWEHFGRLPDADGAPRVVLIDLADLSSEASPARALARMRVDELFPPAARG